MKTIMPSAPLLRSFELWSRFALDNTAMLWGAGHVIGKRTTQMAAHGIAPNERELREMHRMIDEKRAAMVEGSLAAWTELMRASQSGWLEAMRVASRSSLALVPIMTRPTPRRVAARVRATARSLAPAPHRWTAPLDTSLRIADAALRPARARVAANRKRLGP